MELVTLRSRFQRAYANLRGALQGRLLMCLASESITELRFLYQFEIAKALYTPKILTHLQEYVRLYPSLSQKALASTGITVPPLPVPVPRPDLPIESVRDVTQGAEDENAWSRKLAHPRHVLHEPSPLEWPEGYNDWDDHDAEIEDVDPD